jgi:hypothetical protein
MRLKLMLCVVLGVASAAYAKDPKAYQNGKLLQMDAVSCGTAEKDKGAGKKTQEVLCQEYVLQAEQVVYHIRPRDEKHPVLLHVGGMAEFRLEKDKMLMRVEGDNKEREYQVVSMAPRTDSSTADSAPTHMNHLQ